MSNPIASLTRAFFIRDTRPLPEAAVVQPTRIAGRNEKVVSQNTALVIDRSGSMLSNDILPTRLDAALTSCLEFVAERAAICELDRVAVISYGSISRCVCPLLPISHRSEIEIAIRGITASGGTAIGRGLRQAGKQLNNSSDSGSSILRWLNDGPSEAQSDEYVNRIILLSDGHHCMGCEPLPIAKNLRNTGIQIDCIGIGGDPTEVDEDLLRNIASIDEVTRQSRYRFIKDRQTLQNHFRNLATSITR